MIGNFKNLISLIQKYPAIAYGCVGVLVFMLLFTFKSNAETKTVKAKYVKPKTGEIGLNVAGIDEKAYLTRLEKSYFDSQDRIKDLENQMKSLRLFGEKLQKTQEAINKSTDKVSESIEVDSKDKILESVKNNNLELAVAEITPVNQEIEVDSVYLPLGSFCKGTLMTGVYAAADQNNPLPVLIRLDEAFYGPNNSRIPLKGAFALGKAYGDIVSERALIQVIAISSVLPSGTTFESQQNLGYITDSLGELGIHGQIIRNTGKQLALSFMSGFMSGGAQALADQEVTSRTTDNGNVVKEVSGNTAKNAIFSGLSKSAGKMSDYYGQQTENLIPAIHVRNGQEIYFIVQKGVTIHGLSRVDNIINSNS